MYAISLSEFLTRQPNRSFDNFNMLIKDVDNGGMLTTFIFLYPFEPPFATTSQKRPPVLNSKSFPFKALQLEPLVNQSLYANVITFRG